MADDRIMRQADAAKLLGVSRQRVGQLISEGRLPGVPLVLGVRRADVEALAARERPARRPRKGEVARDSQDRPRTT